MDRHVQPESLARAVLSVGAFTKGSLSCREAKPDPKPMDVESEVHHNRRSQGYGYLPRQI